LEIAFSNELPQINAPIFDSNVKKSLSVVPKKIAGPLGLFLPKL
jgi:hypothetical protein